MANDYLKSKWALWFKCMDIKHDGTLAKADLDEIDKKFAHLHHLEAKERKEVIKQLDNFWAEYIFRCRPGPITEQEFVEMQNEDFKADKDKFKQRITTGMKTIFDICDIRHEGWMTLDEYIIAFRASGHENITLDTEFFNAYGPIDGKVSVQKLSESWVHFLTSEDNTIPDVVKEAFDKGL